MSQKAIRETDGKQIIAKWLPQFSDQKYTFSNKQALVGPKTNLDALLVEHPWLASEKLAVKPDQLIKRRGKNDLLLLNASWDQAQQWLHQRTGKPVTVQNLTGILDHFIVEPFYPHEQQDELYFAIVSRRDGDNMLFYHRGGINVGDVDAVAEQYVVPIGDLPDAALIKQKLLNNPDFKCPESKKELLAGFFAAIFKLYAELHFAYLEMNPLIVDEAKSQVIPLDLAAKLDQTAEYETHSYWGNIDWPAPFGRLLTPEEAYIHELDSKTGASLKLTILNPKGRVWTMVAGGGASVVYADTIADLGAAEQMANYGEYSGDPNETLTFEYAKTILDLMTRGDVYPEGKVLVIGGGIANFTNVAETFKGIVKALAMFRDKLLMHKVKIFVRRGGPNYQEGLKMMSDLGTKIGVPIKVFGPETHLTSIVPMALGLISAGEGLSHSVKLSPRTSEAGSKSPTADAASQNSLQEADSIENIGPKVQNAPATEPAVEPSIVRPWYRLFDRNTQTIVYGMQERAVQGMLDFDHICGREKPSVVGMVYPFAGNHFHKFYFGSKEILMPIFQNSTDALKKFPNVDCVINFASFRSVYESTSEILRCPQVRTVAIIAEGVPERYTRLMIKEAKKNNTVIIGPATVGGIKPGALKIGNTGGMLDNIMASKLYRPGSVAFVSKSGGMSNELNNIISRNSNGTCEGVAIGGDRYPGSTFIDHLLRFEADPEIKMMVLLGEVGGVDEYEICQAIKTKKISKPVIAWCIGTCASVFPYEVQFGHAGSLAHSNLETAKAKNAALREAGAYVPDNFDKFGDTIQLVYRDLVAKGEIIEKPEPDPPSIPMDYHWAQKLGLIRKPSSFVSSISDERGEELIYAGMPISAVFQEDIGIGGVVGLLWFKRRLPAYACKFIEMILVLTADHGPAVSGAHNTIVTARAGKDLISAVVSGLVTIGPRFGGAIDGAAEAFSWAYDTRLSPKEFVETMKKQGRLIEGIGHRIKSIHNPDMRVTILKDFIFKHFPSHEIFDFALEVEKVTTQKKANLILNVDGTIGTAFVDLLRGCGAFTREEVDTQVKAGCLNGLFVLGRTVGLIGHYLDQVRLKQGLYRHPWDDISYITENWF